MLVGERPVLGPATVVVESERLSEHGVELPPITLARDSVEDAGVPVADEDLEWIALKRPACQREGFRTVGESRIATSIVAAELVASAHVPDDVFGEERSQRLEVPAAERFERFTYTPGDRMLGHCNRER